MFIDYYLKLKRTEAAAVRALRQGEQIDPASDETTDWEQDEYFDFF